ncbi:MAG TPA: hypothetical protein VFG10_17550 [Saprospiraceae bacterium]|nr:hypothetical protein [Saprospiraceae bacterium]
MRALYLLLIFFISLTLYGQDAQNYQAARNLHESFIEHIRKGMDWDSILKTADTSVLRTYSSDIQQTILYLKSPIHNEVDSFFHAICLAWYSEFPYRVSGYLRDELYILYEEDTTEFDRILGSAFGKSLYPKASQLIHKPTTESIPLLFDYLDNHAATRLVVPGWDWDEPSFYLSVSDMAMELIEIITWCDFFDNAAFSDRLFSNLPAMDQEILISTIRKWYAETHELPKTKAAGYFLDSICPLGYSFNFTCENLLYHGDTLTAKRTYQNYYEKMNMPCRFEIEVGKILLSLGDRRVLEDCANKIMNYRCTNESGRKCVYVLLDSDYPYVDEILGEVVSTEPHSIFRGRKYGSPFVWPTILGAIGSYEKRKMPVTLMALMKLNDELVTMGNLNLMLWKKKYGNQIGEGFRVCDLALLKYNDTIKPVDIKDWLDKSERDSAIGILLKENAGKKN